MHLFFSTQFFFSLRPSVTLLSLLATLLFFSSCQTHKEEFNPVIVYNPPTHQISDLPSAFPPLTSQERKEEWSKEMIMGDAFAQEWDLYRAITCYKRALILLPPESMERKLQLNYDLVLCYYLGRKPMDAISLFEGTELARVNAKFPAFNNLLILLYDCYRETKQDEKADCIFQSIEKLSPETASDLSLYTDLKIGNMVAAQEIIDNRPDKESIQTDMDTYYQFAKSPKKARTLNAILPGLGYYYVGQKRAAMTSFIINALFTAAAYQFFRNGYPAAGIITASLEYGWYCGGINGAGIAANEFNQTLYEGVSKKILSDHRCFPILIFETSF